MQAATADRLPALIETEDLAARLDDETLRILDCTLFLRGNPEFGTTPESGKTHWDQGHIPGSAHVDVLHALSDPDAPFRFTLPNPARFAQAMSFYGVGDGIDVVLYDAVGNSMATRVWWMLRAFGFDDAAVLNGGWKKWTAEARPVSTAQPAFPPARFEARPRPGLFVGKDAVRAAIDDPTVQLVNGLTAAQHAGGLPHYGRPGRIPGSTNVPARELTDPETGAYRPMAELRARFEAAGAFDRPRTITYCGGGIAASNDAFVLHLLGKDDVAVYDGSLFEWSADPAMPMETD